MNSWSFSCCQEAVNIFKENDSLRLEVWILILVMLTYGLLHLVSYVIHLLSQLKRTVSELEECRGKLDRSLECNTKLRRYIFGSFISQFLRIWRKQSQKLAGFSAKTFPFTLHFYDKMVLNALCREIEDLHASLNDIRYVANPHDENNPEVIKVIFFDNISSNSQSHMDTDIYNTRKYNIANLQLQVPAY